MSGISNTENVILIVVKELIIEIKVFREYYMAVVNLVYPSLNYYLLIIL